jgi:hypothetical protein
MRDGIALHHMADTNPTARLAVGWDTCPRFGGFHHRPRGARSPAPGRDSQGRAGRLRWFVALEALAVALGYTTSTLREGPPKGLSDWGYVLGGAVAVAIPLYLKSRRELRQEAATRSAESLAIEMDTKLHLVLGDVMTPIAEVVGRIHQAGNEADRSSLRGQLKQLVVEAAAHLCGTGRTRAIFFELRGHAMRPEAWTGRSDPPDAVFTDQQGDRRGREAMLLVRQHDYLQVDDVADLNVLRAMAQLLGAGLVDRPGTLSRFLSN